MSFDELEKLSKKIRGLGIFFICLLSISMIIVTIVLAVYRFFWPSVAFLIVTILEMVLIIEIINGIIASIETSIRNGKKIAKIVSAIEDINKQINKKEI